MDIDYSTMLNGADTLVRITDAITGARSAFFTDLEQAMARVCVLVYTEFGRRIAENGSLGADHGSQVNCDWAGLDIGVSEDLQITTGLRSVLAEVLTKRLGGTDVDAVFPGFGGPTDVGAPQTRIARRFPAAAGAKIASDSMELREPCNRSPSPGQPIPC